MDTSRMPNLYENTRYNFERNTRKSIIIYTPGGKKQDTYTLKEPLTIDTLSDVYIDSFISNAGTNTGTGSEVFILGVDEFNIRSVAGIFYKSATATASASTEKLTSKGHPFVDGDSVKISLLADAVIPGGLSEDTPYFIRDKNDNDFKLSETSGGSAIDITTDGSGTIRLLGTEPSGKYNNKIIIPNTTGSASTAATIAHRATKFNYVGTINPCTLHKLTISLTNNDLNAIGSGDYWITFVIVSKE